MQMEDSESEKTIKIVRLTASQEEEKLVTNGVMKNQNEFSLKMVVDLSHLPPTRVSPHRFNFQSPF